MLLTTIEKRWFNQDGALVAVSALGNQLGSYAAGAGRVILVVGSQKFVPDLETALSRVREVVFPYENDRVREKMGVDTKLEKVLIIYGEWLPGGQGAGCHRWDSASVRTPRSRCSMSSNSACPTIRGGASCTTGSPRSSASPSICPRTPGT